MQSSRDQSVCIRNRVSACLLGCLLAGCTVVGPSAIRSGRLAYNEAIIETNNQQMLMIVIHDRYNERGNLLAVTSVTANVSVTTSTGIQLGFGDVDDYAGNLVPFSAGAVYEENPTISYVPVAGEKYVRQLMAPVSVDILARFAGTLVDPAPIYTALVSSVNGINNPEFLFSDAEPDPRFSRFDTLMSEFTRARCLHWARDPQQESSLSVVIVRSVPVCERGVGELLRLLGLPEPKDPAARIVLPFSLALDGSSTGGIGITTRSVYNLVEILAAAIQVPEMDMQNGVANSYPLPGLVGKDLRVRYSDSKPEHASVAVNYRNGWFYIDEKDQVTKRFFRLLASLWSITIAESAAGASVAPVLTVPVSR